MSYPLILRAKAIKLRKKGFSLREVAEQLNIALSTTSLWISDIELSNKAQQRLKDRGILGQYRSILTRRNQRQNRLRQYYEKALLDLKEIPLTVELNKLICSIFFWTEGGKFTDTYVTFINSDPVMVELFVKLLKSAFELDERKLRAMVQIHEYHNEKETKEFWSEITKIPLTQFSNSYLKSNTKKRIRVDYKGACRIRYYDYKVALELRSFYNAFADIN